MDELYELVSKDKINSLREENKNLKKQVQDLKKLLKDSPSQVSQDNFPFEKRFDEFEKKFFEEVSKRDEKLLERFENIEDLNKDAINKIIETNHFSQEKLEKLVESMQSITLNIKDLLKDIPSISSEISIKEDINLRLIDKLEEIDRFMRNLKILLAQVKPSNLSLSNNGYDINSGNNFNGK